MSVSLDALLKRVDISTLPTIYLRLDEAISNSQTSIAEIGAIISEDAGISTRLLKLVNSSFYGFPSRIDTISRAVMIVGTHQLRDLALATSVMQMFEGIPEDLINMESFWKHSLACGIAAKVVCSYKNAPNKESFFVAGVLHDVGRLLMFKNIAAEYREVLGLASAEGRLTYEIERERLGFDHAAVGAHLLHLWKLPVFLEELVACHHRPGKAVRYPLEAAILHVADFLVNALELGSSGERFAPRLDDSAWTLTGLPANGIPDVLSEVEGQFSDVVTTLLG
jgi:HD-like signal output (HDOD) protein